MAQDANLAEAGGHDARVNLLAVRAGQFAGREPARETAQKRVARRLTGWQIDPIVDHVNRLQQATVEATERAADRQTGGDDKDPRHTTGHC